MKNKGFEVLFLGVICFAFGLAAGTGLAKRDCPLKHLHPEKALTTNQRVGPHLAEPNTSISLAPLTRSGRLLSSGVVTSQDSGIRRLSQQDFPDGPARFFGLDEAGKWVEWNPPAECSGECTCSYCGYVYTNQYSHFKTYTLPDGNEWETCENSFAWFVKNGTSGRVIEK
jgi:hypothetical protein